jgi:hypothetical protein
VLCRGSGDGDICFALAKHDELGRFFVFVVGWENFCFFCLPDYLMNYALPSSYLFLSFTGEEELALSIQTTGPKHTSYCYIVN